MFSSILVLVFAFAYLNNAATNYSIVYSFAAGDNTCANGYTGFVATAVASCTFVTPSTCTCSGNICGSVQCSETLPSDPSGAVVVAQYNSSSDCSGDARQYIAVASGACNSKVGNLSTKIECAGTFRQTDYTNPDCSGAGTVVSEGPFEGTVCSGGFYISCGLKCFHKESTITVGDKQFSYADLKKENSPCAIPHTFKANGLKIITTCPGVLRVTSEHLVMTPSGFIMAGSLKTGDKLFSKVYSENADCTITDIQSDVNGEYFGLNCETGHVASDGYWVSTFGFNHNIPDAWMRFGSKIFGVKTASRIGDSVANLLQRFGLL